MLIFFSVFHDVFIGCGRHHGSVRFIGLILDVYVAAFACPAVERRAEQDELSLNVLEIGVVFGERYEKLYFQKIFNVLNSKITDLLWLQILLKSFEIYL